MKYKNKIGIVLILQQMLKMYIILKWSIIKMDSFSNNTKINVKLVYYYICNINTMSILMIN